MIWGIPKNDQKNVGLQWTIPSQMHVLGIPPHMVFYAFVDWAYIELSVSSGNFSKGQPTLEKWLAKLPWFPISKGNGQLVCVYIYIYIDTHNR